MKYLICIDSDGTLRRTDGTISNKTKDVIKKLRKQGNIIVISTARPRYHTLKISKEVGIDDYLISSNGTEIYDNKNQKIIEAYYLENNLVEQIYNDTKELNIRTVFVTENTEYVTNFTRNDSQILLENYNQIKDLNIKQIMVIDKNIDLVKEYQSKVEEYNVTIMDSSTKIREEYYFSIISKTASKGTAVITLANYLNIPIENTISIGNDYNDIPMFKVTNYSYAVENASKEAKDNAKEIIPSNDEDGVRILLQNLIKE